MKHLSLALIAVLCTAGSPSAQPAKLTGQEIKALLTGHTVHGTWAGKEYWSFFAGDGRVTRLEAGFMPQDGFWTATSTQYCEDWPTGLATICYDIYRDGDTVVWGLPMSGARYPSTLLTGDQVPK